jgi:hypothetical protein
VITKENKDYEMDYIIDYLPDKMIVVIKMKGRVNFQIAEKYSKESLKLAHKNDCTKFLIDHTNTIMPGPVNKIYASGDELQEFGFKNSDRIAIVINNTGDDSNLLVPITKNSRWSVIKYFYSDRMQEAYNWLEQID